MMFGKEFQGGQKHTGGGIEPLCISASSGFEVLTAHHEQLTDAAFAPNFPISLFASPQISSANQIFNSWMSSWAQKIQHRVVHVSHARLHSLNQLQFFLWIGDGDVQAHVEALQVTLFEIRGFIHDAVSFCSISLQHPLPETFIMHQKFLLHYLILAHQLILACHLVVLEILVNPSSLFIVIDFATDVLLAQFLVAGIVVVGAPRIGNGEHDSIVKLFQVQLLKSFIFVSKYNDPLFGSASVDLVYGNILLQQTLNLIHRHLFRVAVNINRLCDLGLDLVFEGHQPPHPQIPAYQFLGRSVYLFGNLAGTQRNQRVPLCKLDESGLVHQLRNVDISPPICLNERFKPCVVVNEVVTKHALKQLNHIAVMLNVTPLGPLGSLGGPTGLLFLLIALESVDVPCVFHKRRLKIFIGKVQADATWLRNVYNEIYNVQNHINFECLRMNFFKKMLGFSADLKTTAESTKIQGTLYRVVKDARSIMFPSCLITFEVQDDNYSIRFVQPASGDSQMQEYAFPVHTDMNLVAFSMNKGGKVNACFEWSLDETGEHIGCYMDPSDKDKFKDVACRILKHIFNDENIRDHLKLCKELNGIPVYKETESSTISAKNSSVSSSKVKKVEQLNDVVIQQAGKEANRMVHSAALYEITDKERQLINEAVVFVLKEVGKFEYEFQIINATGFAVLKKELTPGLIYEINTDLAYIKWLHMKEDYKVVEVNFEGKKDAAMSLKFAVVQCLYEINTKRRLQDAIAEDEISYMRRISDNPLPASDKVVKTYEDLTEELEMEEAKFVYRNKDVDIGSGLEKYRVLCQAKVHNFDVAALGNMLETLKISEDNEIKRVDKHIINRNIDSILLHDNDQKALLNDDKGILHEYDMETGKIVQTYDVASQGIQDVCPEYKLAEAAQFKTFKAVSPNTIYEIDPRTEKGVVNNKSYATSPEFNKISVDCKGRYACGSSNGEVRLYDQIGKNANCKYPGFGDPVLHLDSTQDGKWLLATFQSYLILLPTNTDEDQSLYEQKIKIDDRPAPIRLRIKMEHLQLCKVSNVRMVPAKFDERKGGRQMFIVSGFGEYVVVWNLAHVIRGLVDNYKFMKVDGELVQAEFMFNNVKKLLMTTTNGIIVKENKVRN